MKVTINIPTEIELKTLYALAHVRYWEDATVNGVEDTNGDLIPCRKGDLWCPIIDLDTGIITNWKQGVKAEIHYKVCDEGSYFLQDKNLSNRLFINEDYVPSIMCPKEPGYGDYIIMDVDENGKIDKWNGSYVPEFIEQD